MIKMVKALYQEMMHAWQKLTVKGGNIPDGWQWNIMLSICNGKGTLWIVVNMKDYR